MFIYLLSLCINVLLWSGTAIYYHKYQWKHLISVKYIFQSIDSLTFCNQLAEKNVK